MPDDTETPTLASVTTKQLSVVANLQDAVVEDISDRPGGMLRESNTALTQAIDKLATLNGIED